uniref:Uncharacterized transposon-derived protein F52C9.6 n=1 Tax=Sipha flava TaxID=143950 RepID=A0A2S2QB70_9HEMI
MELLESDEDPRVTEDLMYEKVEDFKYLSAILSTKNDWAKGIGIRISKAEKTFFALTKLFRSKCLSRKTKVRLYTVIVRPTLTYGCEAWTKTKQIEKRLRTFENKIWRRICSPIYDKSTGSWRRRYNNELLDMVNIPLVTSFIKGQRIQWLGYIMRRGKRYC